MQCPYCKKEFTASPWAHVAKQGVTMVVVYLWWRQIVHTWDNEPYIMAGIFLTMIALAFLGEKAIPFLQGLPFIKRFANGRTK